MADSNGTWETCSSFGKLFWVANEFIIKTFFDGSIDKLKTRLVAKWHTQIYGVNYINILL